MGRAVHPNVGGALSLNVCLSLNKPKFRGNRTPNTGTGISVHNLDDDSLLNIFYLCRPNVFDESEDRDNRVIRGGGWGREIWWYKLVQVSKRWRYLILESATFLRLCLVCTRGTPVADMLTHSPPFPLIIDYDDPNQHLTAEDERGIMIALRYRDRVRCIHLGVPVQSLEKIVTVMDDEFPMLEYMHIAPPTKHCTHLILPPKFEAPKLRHIVLYHFASPIGSPLLASAVGLSTLLLRWIHPSTYPHPNHLLQTLSLLPQLQTLQVGFRSPSPNNNIRREVSLKWIITHVTLPNLRWFAFAGVSEYLEALLSHMTTPVLVTLKVHFFHQLSFPVPSLQQFMTITENLRFSIARFCFHDGGVAVWIYPRSETTLFSFYVHVLCEHFDWQVSSMAQIFDDLKAVFPTVVDLTIDYTEHTLSSERHNQADRTLWRKLLGSFMNVKTLRVHEGLVRELSRSLRLDGEPALQLLPELKELVCPTGSHSDDTFSQFIREREGAGRPINLIGSAFPVGRVNYVVHSPAGMSQIRPDHVPVS